MDFSYYLPTKLVVGRECVLKNKDLFRMGKQALVVTSPSAAAKSGALADVTQVLQEAQIPYEVFNEVEANPSLATVKKGGDWARALKADFIVAIGGGSPLDAAKGIAVHATNILPEDGLYAYDGQFPNPPIPIIAIPTTAGTGSEVTPYAVLTNQRAQKKQSFASEAVIPKVAFLDARYTETLPRGITVDTYIDAISHAFEGYLARKATPMSDIFAEQALKRLGSCLSQVRAGKLDFATREQLLFAATLAGIVITTTGTTMLHAMGYPLTYYKGIPHGRANGFLFKGYLEFCQQYAPDRVEKGLAWLGVASVSAFGQSLSELMGGQRVQLSAQEVKDYAAEVKEARNLANTVGEVREQELADIFQESLN